MKLKPEVSIETTVFDDNLAEPDGSFTTGLLPIPEANYTLDPDATQATVFVTDGVDGTGGPTVGITAAPLDVNEGDALTITLTATGELPSDGLEVFISREQLGALGDFITVDEAGIPDISFEGLVGVPTPNEDGSGFIVQLAENTASITLNVFDDGPEEGAATFAFSLLDGENYDIDTSAGSISLTLRDEVTDQTVDKTVDKTVGGYLSGGYHKQHD